MLSIFISYRRSIDDSIYTELYTRLRDSFGSGNIFRDTTTTISDNWHDEIEQRINECSVVLVIISNSNSIFIHQDDIYQEDDYVRLEIEQALKRQKPILPILMSQTEELPRNISCHEYIDFSRNFEDGFTELEHRLKWIETPRFSALRERISAHAEQARLYKSFENTVENYNFKLLHSTIADALVKSSFTVETLAQELDIDTELAEAIIDGTIPPSAISNILLEQIASALGIEPGYLSVLPSETGGVHNKLKNIYKRKDNIIPRFQWSCILVGTSKRDYKLENDDQEQSFYISKYPVTNFQYKIFIEDDDGYRNSLWWEYSSNAENWRRQHVSPSITPSEVHQPLTNISWYDAIAFCRWLSVKSKQQIMLPTEQEWEIASRTYPWDDKPLEQQSCNIGQQEPVKEYPTNSISYNILDMAGNMWEWCLDTYSSNKESASISEENENLCVIRGGLWGLDIKDRNTHYKQMIAPYTQSNNITFRIIRKIPISNLETNTSSVTPSMPLF